LGIGPQSPIPNPQSPIPMIRKYWITFNNLKNINLNIKFFIHEKK